MNIKRSEETDRQVPLSAPNDDRIEEVIAIPDTEKKAAKLIQLEALIQFLQDKADKIREEIEPKWLALYEAFPESATRFLEYILEEKDEKDEIPFYE